VIKLYNLPFINYNYISALGSLNEVNCSSSALLEGDKAKISPIASAQKEEKEELDKEEKKEVPVANAASVSPLPKTRILAGNFNTCL